MTDPAAGPGSQHPSTSSGPRPPEQNGEPVCAAAFVMPVLLALTDASGNTLLPALPGTVCHTALAEVQTALDALTWVEIARQQ
jgi:hypothetical protein